MSPPLQPRQEQPDVEQQIRLLVEEGQIREAQELLRSAGDRVPAGSKMREILGPARARKSPVKGVDRSAEFHWLKTKAAEHPGKWVALVGENLVASSDTLKELLAQLAELRRDVTVINFINRDNDASRLTFEILSQKLDLFGKVLDASGTVLHEPRIGPPEIAVSAVSVELESDLRNIYSRSRTVGAANTETLWCTLRTSIPTRL